MFTQDLDVVLDGRDAPVRVTCDQRDVSALELTDWYSRGVTRVTVLRHMAYTALTRKKIIPAATSWDDFNRELCVHVDGVDQGVDEPDGEGEQGENPTRSTRGRTRTSGRD